MDKEIKEDKNFSRATLENFLAEYVSSGKMASDFYKMQPKQRLETMQKLAAFVLPRLRAVDVAVAQPGKSVIENPILRDLLS